VAAALCLEIYRLVEVGERDEAAALQEKLTPLALAVTKRYGIGGLKAAMNMIGFAGGAVRAPLRPASAEAQAEIAALLDELIKESVSKTEARGERGEFAGVVRP
jgi:4-hydroxy-2-oxoglutarate aldolase